MCKIPNDLVSNNFSSHPSYQPPKFLPLSYHHAKTNLKYLTHSASCSHWYGCGPLQTLHSWSDRPVELPTDKYGCTCPHPCKLVELQKNLPLAPAPEGSGWSALWCVQQHWAPTCQPGVVARGSGTGIEQSSDIVGLGNWTSSGTRTNLVTCSTGGIWYDWSVGGELGRTEGHWGQGPQ